MFKTYYKRRRILFFSISLLIFLIIIGVVYISYSPLTFFILCNEKPNIEVGDKIFSKGVPVGEIENIVLKQGKIALKVEVYKTYKSEFVKGTRFLLKKEGIFSPKHYILVLFPENTIGPRIKRGETFPLETSLMRPSGETESLIEKMKKEIKKDIEKLKEKKQKENVK